MSKGRKINIIINISTIVLLLALVIFLFIRYYDEIKLLGTEEGRQNLINIIQNTGIFGSLVLIIIQSLQVIVAFIPGEFVEIVCGAMFGPFIGLLICVIGLNLGTMAIFGLVKWLGKPFVRQNVNEDKIKFKFPSDPNRLLVIMFFVFLLPGIPKDMLIYLVPLTKVKMHKFMIVSTIARIPGTLSSTFIGAAILEGNYLTSVIVFLSCLLFAIIGLVFNKQIYKFIDTKFISKNNIENN